MKVVVVIDVFRAFTTASYVLEHHPATYKIAVKQAVIEELASRCINPLIIGKPEKGLEGRIYHIPNSPTRVLNEKISNRDIIHRTDAGAKGILLAKDADLILAAGFINATATAQYIKTLKDPEVTFAPMGHEGTTASLEDDLCVEYIQALIQGKKIDLSQHISKLKEGPGKYLFSDDQWQYPKEDFTLCLEENRFNFAIQAIVKDDYALLTRCEQTS